MDVLSLAVCVMWQYNVIVADAIKPANGQAASFDYLSTQAYMDRGEVENELRVRIMEVENHQPPGVV